MLACDIRAGYSQGNGVNAMESLGPDSNRPYRETFLQAASSLYRNMRYLVFIYVVGSALAIVAVAVTSSPGSQDFSLGIVFLAYGIAGLAAAIFLYAFIQLVVLACCAYGEWLCEQNAKFDADS
jgi:uncharacterized membrane protein